MSAATTKRWRHYHLTDDQTHYVAKEVRHTLSIERPNTRPRAGARLSRDEEKRLIVHAYRMKAPVGFLSDASGYGLLKIGNPRQACTPAVEDVLRPSPSPAGAISGRYPPTRAG